MADADGSRDGDRLTSDAENDEGDGVTAHGVTLFSAERQTRHDLIEDVVGRDSTHVPLQSFQHHQLTLLVTQSTRHIGGVPEQYCDSHSLPFP